MSFPIHARTPFSSRRHRKPMSLLLLFACLFLQVNMALAGCLTQPMGTNSTIEVAPLVQWLDPTSDPACAMEAGAALCKAQCDADDGAAAVHADTPPSSVARIALPFRPWQSQATILAPVRPLSLRPGPVPAYLDGARLRV